jgi:hypothetical protein
LACSDVMDDRPEEAEAETQLMGHDRSQAGVPDLRGDPGRVVIGGLERSPMRSGNATRREQTVCSLTR